MEFETVLLDISDGVGTLTFNRPEVLNAINMDLIRDVRAAVKAVEEDSSARVLVITGAGRGFCSGADLASRQENQDPSMSIGDMTADRMEKAFNPMVQDIYDCRLPVVTAINGVAAGGGMGLALLGDIVVAARSAKFIQVFTPQLGIIPDMGCTWHLQRLAGRARALGMAMLGERISAEQAVEWGLIWKCVDDGALMDEVMVIANQLKDGPTATYREVRQALAFAEHATLAEQLEYERERQRVLTNAPNFLEGVMAFLQKRKPVFSGE